MKNAYRKLHHHLEAGRRAALITTFGPKTIAKQAVSENEALWPGDADHAGFTLNAAGEIVELVEYFAPKPRLVILGGGHIALPLVEFAAKLDFNAVVFDDRPSFASPARFPAAQNVICEAFENAMTCLNISSHDYVVIVTRGHRHDVACLENILKGNLPLYVGMIGSKRRIAIIKQQLHAKDVAVAGKLECLHAPIGLAIGAVIPAEIALAIMAEIVKVKRRPIAAPLTPQAVEKTGYYAEAALLGWLADNEKTKYALATVLNTSGSTPRETGAKMVVLPHGQTIGSIGGGCAEAGVIRRALEVMGQNNYCLLEVDLAASAADDGMVCGGVMQVLLESNPRADRV